ncbi:MAG: PHP domain-containing protein [Anaerolineae bacterium]
MHTSTHQLVLERDAAIDLQVHTVYSDGDWLPEQLIDHMQSEGFALAAITDHDRADTVAMIQQLAIEKSFPVLVAVEMTTEWKGEMTDVLCYGFDPQKNALNTLAQDVLRRQQDNTRAVYDHLIREGLTFANGELEAVLAKPSAQQPHELVALLKRYDYGTPERSAGKMLMEGGIAFAMTPTAAVVEAGHHDGAVCLLAHPGRDDGFVPFDVARLDALRREVPIDGLEVHYPLHTPERTAVFLEYAQRHDLLMSSGSDSHRPSKLPIKYPAELSRKLLERVGIEVR